MQGLSRIQNLEPEPGNEIEKKLAPMLKLDS